MELNKQVILKTLPHEKLSESDFHFTHTEIPQPQRGEVLVRIIYLAIDAASRAWMQGDTYRPVLQEGNVMPGLALAEIVDNNEGNLNNGDLVLAETGWQTFAAISDENLIALPTIPQVSYLLSVFGVPGLTAYFGLLRIGMPKAGETLVVSAAAGAVGSIVGQIGKIMGCHVVGIAGGQAKCTLLTSKLGFDMAIDYTEENISQKLSQLCPKGIDLYFDNVGGEILDAAIANMAQYGRIVCCGAVSQYDRKKPGSGPVDVPGQLILKSLSMRGFLLFDYLHEQALAIKDLETWLRSGRLTVVEDIIHGFENLPQALIGVLHGENTGKRLVKL